MEESILKIDSVTYGYEKRQKILDDISYDFEKGKFYAITGPSGSGKTTVLSLMAALDKPNKGKILYNNKDIKKYGYARYRRDYVALIFQSYNLINYMNAIENVVMGMDIVNRKGINHKEEAIRLLEQLNISKQQMKRNIKKLSGGQQQRVAIARAIANDCNVILADEPTGNLDKKASKEIVDILLKLAHEQDKCVIVITHSLEVANSADVVINLDDGKLKTS